MPTEVRCQGSDAILPSRMLLLHNTHPDVPAIMKLFIGRSEAASEQGCSRQAGHSTGQ